MWPVLGPVSSGLSHSKELRLLFPLLHVFLLNLPYNPVVSDDLSKVTHSSEDLSKVTHPSEDLSKVIHPSALGLPKPLPGPSGSLLLSVPLWNPESSLHVTDRSQIYLLRVLTRVGLFLCHGVCC